MSNQNLTDSELFTRIKDDDARAFEALYNRYWPALWRFSVTIMKEREPAKDVVQDVFTMLWDKREGIKIKSSVGGLLYKMTLNVALNKVNKAKFASEFYEKLEQRFPSNVPVNSTEQTVLENELIRCFEEGLSQVPTRARAVFELSRNEDLSYDEISKVLDISKNTVKTQIKVALKILRGKLTLLVGLFFM